MELSNKKAKQQCFKWVNLISLFILTIFLFWEVHPQTLPKQTIETLKAGGEDCHQVN
jgi:hypothetical protein